MDGITYLRIVTGALLILSVGWRLGWHYGRKHLKRQVVEILKTELGRKHIYLDQFGRIVKGVTDADD